MASKSQQSQPSEDESSKGFSKNPDTSQSRLPFEPGQNRKKQPKRSAQSSVPKVSKENAGKASTKSTMTQRAFTGVPEEVSKRMARRMAFFCGIPTSLGMLTFIVSYFIVSQHIFKLPTVVVLLVSLGFFGLGVLGLSYGALSASWDEGRVGTRFGWDEFRVNFGRAVTSWKEARQKAL